MSNPNNPSESLSNKKNPAHFKPTNKTEETKETKETKEKLVYTIGGDNAFNPLAEKLPYWDEYQKFIEPLEESPIKDKIIAYLYISYIKYATYVKHTHKHHVNRGLGKIQEYMENVNKRFKEIKHHDLQEIIKSYISNNKNAEYINEELLAAIKLNKFNDIGSCVEKIKYKDFSIQDCYNLLELSNKIKKIPLKGFKQKLEKLIKEKKYKIVENYLDVYELLERTIKTLKIENKDKEQLLLNIDSIISTYDNPDILDEIRNILNSLHLIKDIFNGVNLKNIEIE